MSAIVVLVSEVRHCKSEWSALSFSQLLQDSLDLDTLSLRIKRFDCIREVSIEEVPGATVFEAGHRKEVLSFLLIEEDFQGNRRGEALGLLMEVR